MNSNKPLNPQKPDKNILKGRPVSEAPLKTAVNNDTPVVSTFEKKVYQQDIDNAEKLFKEGMRSYLNKKDSDKAIEMLKQVIILNPDYLDAHYNLGVLYSEKNETDKAIEMFNRVLEMEPDPKGEKHESSRFNLANQLAAQGRFEEAIEQFEKILEHDPKVVDANYNAGFIYLRNLGDYEKAIKYFKQVLNVFNLHLNAWYNLGLAYHFLGEDDKAMDLWERLVQVSNQFAPAYFNLAVLNKNLGRKDKAMLFFKKYLEVPVKDPAQFRFSKYAARRLKELQKENESS